MDDKDFWLDLITWSNEETQTPTRRWNLFQRWMLENLDDIPITEYKKNRLLDLKKKQYLPELTKEEIRELNSYIHKYSNLSDKTQINFSNYHFNNPFVFSGAQFYLYVLFTNAIFSERAQFNSATFSERADFNYAIFSDWTEFNHATFSGFANFYKAKFLQWAEFNHATFSDWTEFTDLNKFDDTNNKTPVNLNFTDAIFEKYPPKTFGSSLHEGSSFLKVAWPEADKNTAETNIQAYERLRIQVGTLGMVDTRNTLIQKELECYAIIAEDMDAFWRKTYGLISNHGTSIDKPLFILVLLFVGVNLIWLPKIYLARTENFTFWDTFSDIIGFNFNKALPFTKMSGYQTDAFISFIQEAPPCLIALSSFLSIASPIFLFLAGLGLRSKFRLSL